MIDKDNDSYLSINGRDIYILGRITNEIVGKTINAISSMESISSITPIQIFINSSGGDTDAGISLITMMKYCNADIYTHCIGVCEDIAMLIFISGDKRYISRYSSLVINGFDISPKSSIQEKPIILRENRYYGSKQQKALILQENSKYEQVEDLKQIISTSYKFIYFPEKAIEYGFADKYMK